MSPVTQVESHVYRECISLFGEPDVALMYDERTANRPLALERTLVMAWRPTPEDEMTMFATVGMSARPMKNAAYRTELRMFVRGDIGAPAEEAITRFLANLAPYPFDHDLTLGWGHIIKNPGAIPLFEGCSAILLHGAFTDDSQDHTHCGDCTVRFLNVVPITEAERQIAAMRSPDALDAYWTDHGVDIFLPR